MAFHVFGDQSSNVHGFLADFCRRGSPSILSKTFLERASHALRDEVDSLSKLERANIPNFRTLYQLNQKYHAQQTKHPGIDSALLCIAQLAHYIDRVEKQPEEWTSHDQTLHVGFCTGLFSAAAIASTPSVSTLIPLAIQTVLLAFRTGHYVGSLAEKFSHSTGRSDSWAMVVPRLSEEEATKIIDTFHTTNNTPSANHAYISAIASSNIVISGPPSTLQTLREQYLQGMSSSFLPVHGPYHAPHLHSAVDLETLLHLDSPALAAVLDRTKPRSPVISSSGAWFQETDTKALLKAVARECLNDTIMFQKAYDNCIEAAQGLAEKACLIIPHGPAPSADTLAKLLQNQPDIEVEPRGDEPAEKPTIGAPIGNHGPQLGRCKLAIVGMAGRFPDAASHEKLWDLLCQGLDVHRVVPKDRFPVETHYDPTGKIVNTSHTPYGCWIENPGLFDPRFFNMSPREAYQTDPMQRMALTTAYEALEMSGYVPNRTPSTRLDRVGTFYGQTSDDWREINAAQEVDTYFITGGVRAFGPGRINYHFGFSGPSLNIDTACSSSAAALQVACTALWASECDTAIVGGLSCMTNPDIFSGLSRGQFLSKTGSCATFDNGADGYCRADACASVIVKRLDDALADKDNVLAVILGTATNHSADAISITHPHGPTQSVLSTAILDEAGVDPHDVDYVEMHGTGTQAGDGTEMVSVTNVFAPAQRRRAADRPLYLGAVKSNIGHGEAASGVTALIKVLMMLQKNVIPPHVGIKKEINKTFPPDLSDRNVNIAFHATPFVRRDGKPRRVFVNNFSAAGGNTGLLLEDGPKYEPASPDPRQFHVVSCTGKSKSAMLRNAERLAAWMQSNPDTPLSNVAYSTTARRIQHYWRLSVVASTLSEAQDLLKEQLAGSFSPISSQQPNVVFLFSGQGNLAAGLGKEFYSHFSAFREAIDEFNQLTAIHGFESFMCVIDGSVQDIDNLPPVVSQLALCCFEMALAKLWMSWGIQPGAVLGHSLGEYAALHIAGVLSASDTIYLVGTRANLLTEKCTKGTHSMKALKCTVEDLREALGPSHASVNIACMNGPADTVISGTIEEMDEAGQVLEGAGYKCTPVNVPYAFHSAQVDPILDTFAELAKSATFRKPQIPVLSTLLGRPMTDEDSVGPEYLCRHAREPVDVLGALIKAQEASIINEKTAWLEIGPHSVLVSKVRSMFGTTTHAAPTIRRGEMPYKTLSNTLRLLHNIGLNIDWNQYHRDFSDSVRLLDLPGYSFDEKNYWLQYEGDWCLTKNRASIAAPPPVPEKPKLSTTSVHNVIKEEVNGDVCIIETETNLSREDTRSIVTGHLCNGAPLLPSTLYADMAMTICNHGYKLVRPEAEKIGTNVANVEVPKTLIFDETLEAHVLYCTATCNVGQGYADLSWHSMEGGKKTVHAHCKVFYGDTDQWLSEFERVNYLIKSRVDYLMEAEKTGKASKIGRGLAYKLFQALVDYDPRYQGMDEVILDSATCEATAKIVFQTSEKDGNFFFNPYWIDSCCHISGFIINGTDAVDSREQVFISHGWGTLRFAEKLDRTKSYRTYIRMQPVKGTKMMAGDAYIFDGDRIVGVAGDIKFQSIPRKVLNMVLPPRGKALAGMATAPVAQKQAARPPPKKTAESQVKAKQVTQANIKSIDAKLTVPIVSRVFDIIAKEVGVDHDELADNIQFTDLGVDSLMSLTVSGRIREELELDIDSNAFIDHSTVRAFKKYLAQFETHDRKESISSQDSADSNSAETDSDSPEGDSESSLTTPEESDSESLKGNDSGVDLQAIVRQTIAGEMGVDIDEIIAAPDLAHLGMDSLMTLSILGTLREKTGQDISPDLFIENPSLLAVEKALGIGPKPKQAPRPKPTPVQKTSKASAKPPIPTHQVPEPLPTPPESKHCTPGTVSTLSMGTSPDRSRGGSPGLSSPVIKREINTHPGNTTATIIKPPRPSIIEDHFPHRRAISALLQGSVRTATKTLFMIPDGSGCATSYTEIGNISPNWAVYGLFSPFMKTPEEFKCGVYGMAQKFITEIKNKQPEGPYSLAGWSAGGVIAFEMVNQLIKAGDEVENLIIIDAPCPVTIEPLPKTLHQWFASIGLLGDEEEGEKKKKERKVPEWLLPHFAASVTALSNYTAEPIPADKCPRVMAIWCEDGVCKTPEDPRPDPYPTGHALFLLDNRFDFGPNRWDEYLEPGKIVTRHMPGNHFSMMHGKLGKMLGNFIREAVTGSP